MSFDVLPDAYDGNRACICDEFWEQQAAERVIWDCAFIHGVKYAGKRSRYCDMCGRPLIQQGRAEAIRNGEKNG